MKKTITRRMTLAALSSLALLGAAGAPAQTAYPSQPIKFIVPYPAGGATDVLARMVAQKGFGRDIRVVSGPLREGSPLRRCPHTEKIRALGFVPQVSLGQGVAETARWYAENS